jgi:hypothetical protein
MVNAVCPFKTMKGRERDDAGSVVQEFRILRELRKKRYEDGTGHSQA